MDTTNRPAKTVMVVDDNDTVREVLSALLARAGYRVIPAVDGYQAVGLLTAMDPRPDVVLLDLLMPGPDGWHLLRRFEGIPVIVITGASTPPEWAAAEGCAGFLRKPIPDAALLAELRRVLGE
jgi:CheY-like chemotaxis protein